MTHKQRNRGKWARDMLEGEHELEEQGSKKKLWEKKKKHRSKKAWVSEQVQSPPKAKAHRCRLNAARICKARMVLLNWASFRLGSRHQSVLRGYYAWHTNASFFQPEGLRSPCSPRTEPRSFTHKAGTPAHCTTSGCVSSFWMELSLQHGENERAPAFEPSMKPQTYLVLVYPWLLMWIKSIAFLPSGTKSEFTQLCLRKYKALYRGGRGKGR